MAHAQGIWNMELKHVLEHFMASEEVLTERTKFAQMKQEDQESVSLERTC